VGHALSRNRVGRDDSAVGPQRLAALPSTPTVAESGYPGFEVVSWYGLLAPAGTPPEIVDRLQREVAAILGSRAVGETFTAKGLEPVGNTAAESAAELTARVAFWRPVVKATGLAPK
jgi:tripartite-type tricarboxylate transporter receptor subunit TctC